MPCKAQSRIFTGTIADASTKEVISFAAISFKNSFSGTAANESGYYQLNIAKEFDNDSLQISFLGYSPKMICVCDLTINDSIFLVRNDFQLNEIVVRNWQTFKSDWVAVKPNPADRVRLTVAPSNEPDPALEKIKADALKAAPMPESFRQFAKQVRKA
jgi:hypothetical protein